MHRPAGGPSRRSSRIGQALISVCCLAPAMTVQGSEVRAVLDLTSGAWLAKPAPGVDRPYPAGSLFKIATACAALRHGARADSTHLCDGRGCWLPGGHGRLDLAAALACSCSAYFSALAGHLDSADVCAQARRLGFITPARLTRPAAFAGDDPSLTLTPTAAVRLMTFIATGQGLGEVGLPDADRRIVRAALVQAAQRGTSAELLRHLPSAAGKTGTALTRHGALLGWCVGFTPAGAPRYVFAVLVPGLSARRGAVPVAGNLLQALNPYGEP